MHTASGAPSSDLEGYLIGMDVRDCFGRLYGADLVNTLKQGPEFYVRIFADAGVSSSEVLVVDDQPIAVKWAAELGARTVLVGSTDAEKCKPDLVISSLVELPQALQL